MARSERTIKRLIIALAFAVMLIFTCNALWLLAWTSYDYSTEDYSTDVTVDGENGNANYIGDGNNGDISYGEDNSKKDLPPKDQDKK